MGYASVIRSGGKLLGVLVLFETLLASGWVDTGYAKPQTSNGSAAQAKPGGKPASPATKGAAAKPSPSPAPQTSSESAAQAKPGGKPASPAAKSSAPKPSPKSAAKVKPARGSSTKKAPAKPGAPEPTLSTTAKGPVLIGKRDPFKLPAPPSPGGGGAGPGPEITGPLPPGSRGLVIGQLRVEGIVRLDTTNTMIAIVTSFTNRAYFLRENDAVYNGVVSKITPDSVIFSENFLDPFGRVSTREVVKRLGG